MSFAVKLNAVSAVTWAWDLAGASRRACNRGGRALAWLMAILALATAGCTATSTESTSRDPGPELSNAELALIERAEAILVKGCMEKHGFKYWAPPPAISDEGRDFPYVVDDVGWAHRHGYGSDLFARQERLRKNDPNTKYLNSLTPERRAAASVAFGGSGTSSVEVRVPGGATIGQSATGCLAEAQQALYGDFPAWVRAQAITGNLSQLFRPAVERDHRFTAAVESWAGCMSEKSLPYPSPLEIQKALPGLTGGQTTEQARVIERRLSVAEATCANKTGLAATTRTLDQRYGDPVRKKYGKEIDAKRRLQRAALERARDIAPARP